MQNFQTNVCKGKMKNVAANFVVKLVKSDFAKTLFNGLPLKPPFQVGPQEHASLRYNGRIFLVIIPHPSHIFSEKKGSQ